MFAAEQAANRRHLFKAADRISFWLVREFLCEVNEDAVDSDLMHLLYLCEADDPQMLSPLRQWKEIYTSPQVQNRLLRVMAVQILREIAAIIRKGKFFSIMLDEVTDVSNKDQVIIYFVVLMIALLPMKIFLAFAH